MAVRVMIMEDAPEPTPEPLNCSKASYPDDAVDARDLVARPLLGRTLSSQQRADKISQLRADLLQDKGKKEVTPTVSPAFTKFMGAIIVLSAVRLGVQCQWSELDYPFMGMVYFFADVIFAVIFVVEIVIKLMAERSNYFRNVWNILDVIITIAGLFDLWIQMAGNGAHGPKRMFTLRFLRVIRLIRVLKGIDELVVVVDGITKAMTSVAWVFLLLLIVVYMFGVFITMELGQDEEIAVELGDVNYFGDLQHSMLTLIDIALLAEWPEIIRPIMHHRPMLLPLLLFFMMVSTFGVMNILIGVIVDSTAEARREMESSHKRKSLVHASMLWEDTLHKQGLGQHDLLKHQGEEGMEQLLERRKEAIQKVVQVVMDSKCIDFPQGLTPDDVVNLLDFDGNNDLSHEEFLSGLGRLLLGNDFQLTCLMLTMMGKMRKESRCLIEGVQVALEQNRNAMDDRLKKIEDKIWLKLQARNGVR